MTNELFSALRNGVAVFTFIKKNGETRKAIGTLKPEIIRAFKPNATLNQWDIAMDTNRYFDLECQEWRRISASGANARIVA